MREKRNTKRYRAAIWKGRGYANGVRGVDTLESPLRGGGWCGTGDWNYFVKKIGKSGLRKKK